MAPRCNKILQLLFVLSLTNVITETLASENLKNTVWFSCFSGRDPLSEVMCLVRGVSHCLLRLSAVLHRQVELGLHLLLQHAALQRAQEEASCLISGGDPRPTDNTHALGLLPDAPPPDVGRRSHLMSTVQSVHLRRGADFYKY